MINVKVISKDNIDLCHTYLGMVIDAVEINENDFVFLYNQNEEQEIGI